MAHRSAASNLGTALPALPRLAAGASKPATLSTGAIIQVPLFVNTGERIKVDTRTDTYLGRVQG